MNKEGYKIILIKDATNSKYGKCIYVAANPVRVFGQQYLGFNQSIDSSTTIFFFPMQYLEQLMTIERGDNIWHPTPEEYFIQRQRLEELDCRITVKNIYMHNSFEDNDYYRDLNSGHEINLIPSTNSKIEELSDTFYKDYSLFMNYSFSEYVESLADGYNYFVWLFNESRFYGYKLHQLPASYVDEFYRFLEKCSDYENNLIWGNRN